jgi:hypothetical protein
MKDVLDRSSRSRKEWKDLSQELREDFQEEL